MATKRLPLDARFRNLAAIGLKIAMEQYNNDAHTLIEDGQVRLAALQFDTQYQDTKQLIDWFENAEEVIVMVNQD